MVSISASGCGLLNASDTRWRTPRVTPRQNLGPLAERSGYAIAPSLRQILSEPKRHRKLTTKSSYGLTNFMRDFWISARSSFSIIFVCGCRRPPFPVLDRKRGVDGAARRYHHFYKAENGAFQDHEMLLVEHIRTDNKCAGLLWSPSIPLVKLQMPCLGSLVAFVIGAVLAVIVHKYWPGIESLIGEIDTGMVVDDSSPTSSKPSGSSSGGSRRKSGGPLWTFPATPAAFDRAGRSGNHSSGRVDRGRPFNDPDVDPSELRAADAARKT